MLIEPANTASPGPRVLGTLSPVTGLSSTPEVPSVISPSAGIRSPGRTSTVWPMDRLAAGTSRVVSPVTSCAVFGHQIRQRPDAVARLAGGHAFQHLAHGEEEDDQRRLFRRVDEQRADGGDGHQAFDGEGLPHPQRGKGALRHRGHADQAGGDEGPFADSRAPDTSTDPGGTQQTGR